MAYNIKTKQVDKQYSIFTVIQSDQITVHNNNLLANHILYNIQFEALNSYNKQCNLEFGVCNIYIMYVNVWGWHQSTGLRVINPYFNYEYTQFVQ